MRKIEINTFITVMAFNNESEFFREVKGTDAIGITDKSNIIDTINNHKSCFSMIEGSVIGENTIENNKDNIIRAINILTADEKWIILRYVMPKIDLIYDNNPRIIGWSYRS